MLINLDTVSKIDTIDTSDTPISDLDIVMSEMEVASIGNELYRNNLMLDVNAGQLNDYVNNYSVIGERYGLQPGMEGVISTVTDAIRRLFKAVINMIKRIYNYVAKMAKALINFFKNLFSDKRSSGGGGGGYSDRVKKAMDEADKKVDDLRKEAMSDKDKEKLHDSFNDSDGMRKKLDEFPAFRYFTFNGKQEISLENVTSYYKTMYNGLTKVNIDNMYTIKFGLCGNEFINSINELIGHIHYYLSKYEINMSNGFSNTANVDSILASLRKIRRTLYLKGETTLTSPFTLKGTTASNDKGIGEFKMDVPTIKNYVSKANSNIDTSFIHIVGLTNKKVVVFIMGPKDGSTVDELDNDEGNNKNGALKKELNYLLKKPSIDEMSVMNSDNVEISEFPNILKSANSLLRQMIVEFKSYDINDIFKSDKLKGDIVYNSIHDKIKDIQISYVNDVLNFVDLTKKVENKLLSVENVDDCKTISLKSLADDRNDKISHTVEECEVKVENILKEYKSSNKITETKIDDLSTLFNNISNTLTLLSGIPAKFDSSITSSIGIMTNTMATEFKYGKLGNSSITDVMMQLYFNSVAKTVL